MRIKKIKQALFSALMISFLLILPYFVLADTVKKEVGIMSRLETVGKKSGFSQADEKSLASNLGLIVSMVLSLLGILFIILIIIGGFTWMTAGGKEEQIKKAQKNISNALIGLIIVLAAYAIWNLIDRLLVSRM